MTTDVVTASPEQPVATAFEEMRRRDVHHLVVVQGGHAVGIMSAHDHGRRGATVRDVMHAPIVCAGPNTTVREAANLLRGHSIGCLPVVERERLVGIVTTTDLLEILGRGAERPVPKAR